MVGGSEEGGFAALVEQVRSEVRAVAEGHSSLVRGQEELRGMIAALSTRVGFVEDAVTDGFKEVRGLLVGVNARIDALVERFEAHGRTHPN